MACTLHVAWDDQLAGYDFGPGHPLAPVRVELTIELARAFGVFAAAGVSVERPVPATDEQLETVHLRQYIAAVRQAAGPEPGPPALAFGLGAEDNPVFAGMHDASALVTGATLAAARAVWTGTARHGASIAGGLHHAMRGSASGFCVYNDPAIAVTWLLLAGAKRIAYVDVDVHHADGVQAAFYDDPRVLTISMHEHPATALFPGTGLPSETGGPGAEGSAVNVALPAGLHSLGYAPYTCPHQPGRSWPASCARAPPRYRPARPGAPPCPRAGAPRRHTASLCTPRPRTRWRPTFVSRTRVTFVIVGWNSRE